MAFLELTHVTKRFGNALAVDDFNLAASQGELVAFLGPSGCGKTTTLRMVAGFELPDSGTISVNGNDITYQPASQRKLGMVFQSYALFPNMTVADNIGFGLSMARTPAPKAREQIAAMLQIIDMAEFAGRYPHQLSGGQQQRVALARALAIQPQVLLLDEPLSALDAQIRGTLRQEIRAIQRRLGITTIFVTHDQEEALSIADRVVVMSRGKIEQLGTPFEIYNFPQTRFVASFIGTLNLLPATVVNAIERRIAVDGQELRVGAALPAIPDDELILAIRPEAITLATAAEHENVLHGTIEDVTFLGAVVRLRLRLHNHLIAFDLFNNPNLAVPQNGQPLSIRVAPEACIILDRATAPAAVAN